jgi:uncharacterized protein (TIGR00369 family)
MADMERLRARTREPGLANPGHAAQLGGLALLQAMVRGEVPDPPITRTLDYYLLEVESGRAVFQGLPQFAHYNPIGTVHGGWHATLLDSAMACAVHTLVEPGSAYTTLEFKIHCVRPLTDRTGPVRAEGKVVAAGRRTATAEGRLLDAEGRVYSHGTTTCMFLEAAA